MADSKLVDLTADASPTGDDLIYVVNDPGGTPADRKVTLTNLAGSAPFTGAFAPLPTFTSYTPVIVQNGTRTTSAASGRYVQIGEMVYIFGEATISDTGTSNNSLTFSLPVTMAGGFGQGWFFDASSTQQYAGFVILNSTTTAAIYVTGNVNQAPIGFLPSIAVANGDKVRWSFLGEAA